MYVACKLFVWRLNHLSKNSFGKIEHKGYKYSDKKVCEPWLIGNKSIKVNLVTLKSFVCHCWRKK